MPDKPEIIGVSGKEIGLLTVKVVLKIFIVILVAVQFIPGMSFFGNWWIVIGILFFAYFQMPMEYSTDEPHKAIEAWAKWIIGFFIAIFLLIALSPNLDLGVGLPLIGVVGICAVIAILFSYGFKVGGGILFFAIMTAIMYFLVMPWLGTNMPQAAPIFFLTLAFFFVAPERTESKKEEFYYGGEW